MSIPLTQGLAWCFPDRARLEESTAGRTECRVRVSIFDRISPGGEMMPTDEAPDIKQARRWFAEELRHTAHVRSPTVIEAFATVPREHFVGPGPWRVLSRLGGPDYWTIDDSDPRRLCHDVLVAIDETRRLNNGQPSLWATLFDQLAVATGDRVVHVGAGLGYYSAILAEIVGPRGDVTAIEVDAGLAERARANLARSWPQANVIATDG